MEQHVVINIHMIAEKTSFETKQVLNKVGNMLKNIEGVSIQNMEDVKRPETSTFLSFCRITNS